MRKARWVVAFAAICIVVSLWFSAGLQGHAGGNAAFSPTARQVASFRDSLWEAHQTAPHELKHIYPLLSMEMGMHDHRYIPYVAGLLAESDPKCVYHGCRLANHYDVESLNRLLISGLEDWRSGYVLTEAICGLCKNGVLSVGAVLDKYSTVGSAMDFSAVVRLVRDYGTASDAGRLIDLLESEYGDKPFQVYDDARGLVLTAVAKLGGKPHLPFLRSFLDESDATSLCLAASAIKRIDPGEGVYGVDLTAPPAEKNQKAREKSSFREWFVGKTVKKEMSVAALPGVGVGNRLIVVAEPQRVFKYYYGYDKYHVAIGGALSRIVHSKPGVEWVVGYEWGVWKSAYRLARQMGLKVINLEPNRKETGDDMQLRKAVMVECIANWIGDPARGLIVICTDFLALGNSGIWNSLERKPLCLLTTPLVFSQSKQYIDLAITFGCFSLEDKVFKLHDTVYYWPLLFPGWEGFINSYEEKVAELRDIGLIR